MGSSEPNLASRKLENCFFFFQETMVSNVLIFLNINNIVCAS